MFMRNIVPTKNFYSDKEIVFRWHELGLSIDDTAGDQLGNYDVDLKQENSTRFDLNNLLGFYIPSALFTGVAWSSVFWPPEVIPGRTVLIITSLLAVSNLYADSRTEYYRLIMQNMTI
ncbi:hypothetical protein Anas_08511 [Armadillidium nasatum]|uniref:Uncharacterized protein n=1 Tax=Armadillidium nasatum TaxID=96803 RepID=A0A5N5TB40_9CRUS|nr:hypothetical protein Anas_08511 [Armadillidium nasatum]